MAEKKSGHDGDSAEIMIEKAKDIWARYSKHISVVFVIVILGISGYFIYKNYYQKPREEKAVDAIFRAEEYFRKDSFELALKGDGQNYGFLKVIDKYGGTDAGNLARFYAGACYIHLDDNANAVKQLNKFSTSSKPLMARKYKLLGDAYADMDKPADAVTNYKKSAHVLEEDKTNSANALFLAAYLTDRVLKKPKDAIELYKELKKKFPITTEGRDADKYLAQLGVYNTD